MLGLTWACLQIAVLVVVFPFLSADPSCSDCIGISNTIMKQSNVDEKCRAFERFMQCVDAAMEIYGICPNVDYAMRLFHKDELAHDYNCESDDVGSELQQKRKIREGRDEGLNHPFEAVFGFSALEDEAANKTSNETVKVEAKKGYVPSITGLYIAMGIWAGVFLSTIVGLTIGCIRMRTNRRKERQSQYE